MKTEKRLNVRKLMESDDQIDLEELEGLNNTTPNLVRLPAYKKPLQKNKKPSKLLTLCYVLTDGFDLHRKRIIKLILILTFLVLGFDFFAGSTSEAESKEALLNIEQKPDSFYNQFPNRDVPSSKFDKNAWQIDEEYVKTFIKQSLELVRHAKESMYIEYGYGGLEEELSDEMKQLKSKLFEMKLYENITTASIPKFGGYSNKESMEGLAKRLLHAVMTQDTFTVVMGGHSAAAGHGNHFKQSYMLSLHKLLYPVFYQLGVRFSTRNMAMGGLGTLQSGIAASSIYGDDIDMLLWDSSMTEKEQPVMDLMYRQALMGGKRPPTIWNGLGKTVINLFEDTGIEMGRFGDGKEGVQMSMDEAQARTLPFSSQFLNCAGDFGGCGKIEKYSANCWIDRPDVTPETKQKSKPDGQASWHPGWRYHQLTGRVIAFTILNSLERAFEMWSEAITAEEATDGKDSPFPIDDSVWHVTKHYESIQEKARKLRKFTNDTARCENYGDPTGGENGGQNKWLQRICHVTMKARTEFTPRVNPYETSITGICEPNEELGVAVTYNDEEIYFGPDVRNPMIENIPDGEFDIVARLSESSRYDTANLYKKRGIHFKPVPEEKYYVPGSENSTNISNNTATQNDNDEAHRRNLLLLSEKNKKSRELNNNDEIKPGYGWWRDTHPGNCDGSWWSTCDRSQRNACLLYGHNDGRGGLQGDSYSGWLVMNLEDVKEGECIGTFMLQVILKVITGCR